MNVRSYPPQSFEAWWNEIAKTGDPFRRGNLVHEAFEAGRAGPSADLEFLRSEVRRLAHLVIRHNSDPKIMFSHWADDPRCCSTALRGKR